MSGRDLVRWCGSLCLTLMVLGSQAAEGGQGTSIQGIGMGGTSVASSRGIDAVGINPANLARSLDGVVSIALSPVAVSLGSDFLNYDLYTRYFTGVATDSGRIGYSLTDADKREILNAFPGSVGHAAAEAEARPLGVAVNLGDLGTVALTMTDRVAGVVTIPRSYVEFLFYGNPPGSVYDFSQSSGVGFWMREYALSYGTNLPSPVFLRSLSAGASLKLVSGFGYYELEHFKSTLTTSAYGALDGTIDLLARGAGINPGGNSSIRVSPFPDVAGRGFGLDLGAAGELTDFLRFGIGVTDIGSMTWDANVRQTRASATIHLDNPLDAAQRDSVEKALQGTTQEGSAFSTTLPTSLRIGVAIELHKIRGLKKLIMGELLVAADYNQGLTGTFGSSTNPRVSLGVEYKPLTFLPIRAGVSVGGIEGGAGVAFGLGFHFGVFDLDLASENVEWIFSPSKTAHGSLAMGMRFGI